MFDSVVKKARKLRVVSLVIAASAGVLRILRELRALPADFNEAVPLLKVITSFLRERHTCSIKINAMSKMFIDLPAIMVDMQGLSS
jgi:hypothetical protein